MAGDYVQIYLDERGEETPKITRRLADSFSFGESARNAIIIKLADYGIITARAAGQLRKDGWLAMEMVRRIDTWGIIKVNGREALVEPAKFRGFALDIGRVKAGLKKR